MKSKFKITGTVVSGRNRSTEDISQYKNRINKIIGTRLYPGTLNLVLDKPILLGVGYGASFDNEKRYLWEITGPDPSIPIYLYRWIGCPLHVIELISSERLRDLYNLQDGSKLEMELDSRFLLQMPFKKYLLWFLLWKGRASWYYKRETYKEKVYKFKKLRQAASQNRRV